MNEQFGRAVRAGRLLSPQPRFDYYIPENHFASRLMVRDKYTHQEYPFTPEIIIKVLNWTHEEKEFWKHEYVVSHTENDILIDEILNSGCEFSESFRRYMERKHERYKFMSGDR